MTASVSAVATAFTSTKQAALRQVRAGSGVSRDLFSAEELGRLRLSAGCTTQGVWPHRAAGEFDAVLILACVR